MATTSAMDCAAPGTMALHGVSDRNPRNHINTHITIVRPARDRLARELRVRGARELRVRCARSRAERLGMVSPTPLAVYRSSVAVHADVSGQAVKTHTRRAGAGAGAATSSRPG